MAAQGALYQWNLPLAPKAGDSTNKGHRDTQSKQLVTIESLNHCEAVLIFESPVRLVFAPFGTQPVELVENALQVVEFKATNSKYSETRGYKEQISSTA
jgi:hypothetical protein